MNLSERLETGLTSEALALIGLIKTEAERLSFPLYMVGGSVRDLILGRAVKDFDLTVEGNSGVLAEFVMKKYGGHIMVHSRFGTATWTLNASTFKRLNFPLLQISNSPVSFDLITARSETYARPGALPTVKFSSIQDDLRRRDFTINAMALRLDGSHYGTLYDPTSGYMDLRQELIRVLHERSFLDDPTRIFRAVRYAGRYGFEIASETLNLMNDAARRVLAEMSGERLRHEFDLIFEEHDPGTILKRVKELDLLGAIHPALQATDSNPLILLSNQPEEEFGAFVIPDMFTFRQSLGWVLYLLNLSGKDIETIGRRLSFPTLLTRAARESSSLNREMATFTDSTPSQLTARFDQAPVLGVYAVYLVKDEPKLRDYLTDWRNIKPYTTGYTLQGRGLEPGPKYKEILTRLRAAWLDGEVKSEGEEMELLGSLLSGN